MHPFQGVKPFPRLIDRVSAASREMREALPLLDSLEHPVFDEAPQPLCGDGPRNIRLPDYLIEVPFPERAVFEDEFEDAIFLARACHKLVYLRHTI